MEIPEKRLNSMDTVFGSIEFIFKNQKSNGFYLESTKMRNIHAFATLFGILCIAILWLTILGCDYSKNKNHFKITLKLELQNAIIRYTQELFLFLTLDFFSLIWLLNPQNMSSSNAISFCMMFKKLITFCST